MEVIVSYLKEILENRDCIVILRGDLASGKKTTLVKHFVKAIGVNDTVNSPTFFSSNLWGKNLSL